MVYLLLLEFLEYLHVVCDEFSRLINQCKSEKKNKYTQGVSLLDIVKKLEQLLRFLMKN